METEIIIRPFQKEDAESFYRNVGQDPAFLEMSGVFAELELSMIRARVRSGMQNARDKGRKIGRPQTTKDDISVLSVRFHQDFIQQTKDFRHIIADQNHR